MTLLWFETNSGLDCRPTVVIGLSRHVPLTNWAMSKLVNVAQLFPVLLNQCCSKRWRALGGAGTATADQRHRLGGDRQPRPARPDTPG